MRIAIHGIYTRNQALLLINDKVLLGNDHPTALFKYLQENNLLEQFVYDYYFENYKDKLSLQRIEKMAKHQVQLMNLKNYFNIQLKEAIWEYGARNLSFTKIPIVLGHYIKNIQGKEKIALIMPSITNITLNEAIQYIINKFPNAIIVDDDTDKILYSSNKNLKMNIEESWFTTNIEVLNFSHLHPLETSIFNTYLLQELSYINGFKNSTINYDITDNSFTLKINLVLTNTVIADNDIVDLIYTAVCDAIIETNKYFYENNIDNYLRSNGKYTLQY